MYVFDTCAFWQMANYYPTRFPTIWERVDGLATTGVLRSVREVHRELKANAPSEHLSKWVETFRDIFHVPTEEEQAVILEMFKTEQNRGLVRRQSILKGRPVADPFVIAAAKVRNGVVVTQEQMKPSAARIPNICSILGVTCIDVEEFLRRENLP